MGVTKTATQRGVTSNFTATKDSPVQHFVISARNSGSSSLKESTREFNLTRTALPPAKTGSLSTNELIVIVVAAIIVFVLVVVALLVLCRKKPKRRAHDFAKAAKNNSDEEDPNEKRFTDISKTA